MLHNLQSDDFLQAISLLVTQERRRKTLAGGATYDKAPGISCKRKDILKLEVANWMEWADRVEEGFVRAARFLHGQKIFKARDLPYARRSCPWPRSSPTSATLARRREPGRRSRAGTGAACWANSTAARSRVASPATCLRFWAGYVARRANPSRSPNRTSRLVAC